MALLCIDMKLKLTNGLLIIEKSGHVNNINIRKVWYPSRVDGVSEGQFSLTYFPGQWRGAILLAAKNYISLPGASWPAWSQEGRIPSC